MCCIIHRIKGTATINELDLKKIIAKNDDGWGIAYLNDDAKMVVKKSMKMSDSIDEIRALEKEDREFVFHARWATHGETNEKNCHPFPVGNFGQMFHNGKIAIGIYKNHMSDSFHFAEKVRKHLGKGNNLSSIIKQFEKMIDDSRLAFLTNDGVVHRFGTWHNIDGNLYSKIDWQNYYVSSGTRTSGYGDWDDWTNEGGNTGSYPTKRFTNTPFNSISDSERSKIEVLIAKGDVRDEHIEKLSVADVAEICSDYPDIMANYLFELIHRGDQ